jgi:putative flippase GtrA
MIASAAKYIVVGILGTATHLALLYVTVEFFFFSPLLGSSTAFVWVVIQSYLLNRNWTFQSDKKHTRTLPRYLIVSGVGFLSNFLLMYFMVNVLGIWYMTAQILTALVIPIMNFLLNRYWTFS